MYIVASVWQITGDEQEVLDRGRKMRDFLRSHPAVGFLHHFKTAPDEIMVVVGYKDEASYKALISDPNGEFEKRLAEVSMEDVARWKQSWKGESEE